MNIFNKLCHCYYAWQNNLFAPWILSLPLRKVRYYYLKSHLGYLGPCASVLRNVEIRVPRNIFIKENSVVNSHCLLDGRGGKIIIGNNVDIAQETNIWTLQHDPHSDSHQTKGGDVVIEDYVWIASRVTILPKITIGKGAVIATNSVVTKDIPPMTIVAGIPAKAIGKRESQLLYTLNYKPLFR